VKESLLKECVEYEGKRKQKIKWLERSLKAVDSWILLANKSEKCYLCFDQIDYEDYEFDYLSFHRVLNRDDTEEIEFLQKKDILLKPSLVIIREYIDYGEWAGCLLSGEKLSKNEALGFLEYLRESFTIEYGDIR
jgi:hypothetical protein